MDVEDLGLLGEDAGAGGGRRPPSGGSSAHRVGWLALAVLAILAGLLIPGAPGRPEPSRVTFPEPTLDARRFGDIPGSPPYVSLISVCPRRGAAFVKNFDISFYLVNIATVDVTIDEIQPWLAPVGLINRGPPNSGGSCRNPGKQPVRSVLAPNSRRMFTLHFVLPRRCSSPMPILAEVQFDASARRAQTRMSLYDDLVRDDVNACHR